MGDWEKDTETTEKIENYKIEIYLNLLIYNI
jgi:hypothetical protein